MAIIRGCLPAPAVRVARRALGVAAFGATAIACSDDSGRSDTAQTKEKDHYVFASEPGVQELNFSIREARFQLTSIPGSTTVSIKNLCGRTAGYWLVDTEGGTLKSVHTGDWNHDGVTSAQIAFEQRGAFGVGTRKVEWTPPKDVITCRVYEEGYSTLSAEDRTQVDMHVNSAQSFHIGLFESRLAKAWDDGPHNIVAVAVDRILDHPHFSVAQKIKNAKSIIRSLRIDSAFAQRQKAYEFFAKASKDQSLDSQTRWKALAALMQCEKDVETVPALQQEAAIWFFADPTVADRFRLDAIGHGWISTDHPSVLPELETMAGSIHLGYSQATGRPSFGANQRAKDALRAAKHLATVGWAHSAWQAFTRIAKDTTVFPPIRLQAIRALANEGKNPSSAIALAREILANPVVNVTGPIQGPRHVAHAVKAEHVDGFPIHVAEVLFELGDRSEQLIARLANESDNLDVMVGMLNYAPRGSETYMQAYKMFERRLRNAAKSSAADYHRTIILGKWLKHGRPIDAIALLRQLQADWFDRVRDYIQPWGLNQVALRGLFGLFKAHGLNDLMATYTTAILNSDLSPSDKFAASTVAMDYGLDLAAFPEIARTALLAETARTLWSRSETMMFGAATYLCARGDLASFNLLFEVDPNDTEKGRRINIAYQIRRHVDTTWGTKRTEIVKWGTIPKASILKSCRAQLSGSTIQRFTDMAQRIEQLMQEPSNAPSNPYTVLP